MLPFIAGLVIGGLAGFLMCGLLHIHRDSGFESFSDKKPHDRRGQQKATFPLTDSDGLVVYADRRIRGITQGT